MPDFLWSFGGFVVAISVLVAFHEFGHYWVARRCGVKVLRFSIGFGRSLWTHRSADGVEWMVAAIPLGGYVKMLDEREGPVPEELRSQAFNNAPVGKRFLIVAAGPLFNFMLAVAFYWMVMILGVQGIKPMIAAPAERSAAAVAGLLEGEQVLRVAGTPTPTWTELRTELLDRALAGGQLPLEVLGRDQRTRQVELDLRGVRVDPEYVFDDLGLQMFQPPIPPVLGGVLAGGAGEAAGLRAGDHVVAIDGAPIATWQELVKIISARPETVVRIEVQRGAQRVSLNAVVARVEEGGRSIGRLGVEIAPSPELWQDLRAESRRGPLAAIPAAVEQTWRMSALTLKMLWRMVLGDVSIKNVSGPIQIAQVAGFTAQVGLVSFLSFMAVVSVSLGVLNLLPVPLLDGGHLLFYMIEAVKGSPLSDRAQEAGQRVGLTFLMMMMGLAFFNDVMRLLN
ncbi:MAG TPA: RIP metalloprotease RseP [Solimonas sp.]|nr:RIP metalloprotease RseP [Solimonas sp.]